MKIPKFVTSLAILAAANSAFAQTSSNVWYHLTELAVEGSAYSSAYGINSNGQVVGEAWLPTGPTHGILWQNGTIIDLTPGSDQGVGVSINNAGQVVGRFNDSEGSHAFFWNGAPSFLPTFGDTVHSTAVAINSQAQIAGSADTQSISRAVSWQGGGAVPLIPGAGYSGAMGINDMGEITGFIDTEGMKPFIYNGGLTLLGGLGGGYGVGLAINNHSQVVGYSEASDSTVHAFLWENGAMSDLGMLAGGDSGYAYGLNNRGQVVGSASVGGYNYHAALWENGQVIDLNDRIAPGLGWTLEAAMGINEAGQIVGYGVNGVGMYFGYLLTPLQCVMAVDGNRDGEISFEEALDKTTAAMPLRFWLNNDYDFGAEDRDPDQTNLTNLETSFMDNKRDLEDFQRLRIKLGGETIKLVTNGTLKVGLRWENVTEGNPAINVYQAVEIDGGKRYLEDDGTAQQQITGEYGAPKAVVGGTGVVELPGSLFTNMNASVKVHLLFEGASAGKGELVTVLMQGSQEIFKSEPVHMDLKNIKQMYERASLGDSEGAEPEPLAIEKNIVATDPNESHQLVVFVHGINNTYWEYENTSETMFKRLWHQGYKGRFAALRWPCLTWGWVPNDYNSSEFIAHKSGLGASRYFNKLRSRFTNYTISVAAHSQGNNVMMESLKEQLAGGFQALDNYVVMQGAIPAQSYDPGAPTLQVLTDQEQVKATPNTYAGYPGNVGSAVRGTITSFYNESDFALATGNYSLYFATLQVHWVKNQLDYKPDTGFGYGTDGVNAWWNVAPGQPIPVTDPKKIMAFVARSRSKAIGAQASATGVNLAGSPYGFSNSRADHSGEFTRSIQQLKDFYHDLGLKLGVLGTQ